MPAPRQREKNITGQGKDVYRRGEGMGTGPVGKQDAYSQRRSQSSSGANTTRGGLSISKLIIIAAMLLGVGGGGISLLGGNNGAVTNAPSSSYQASSSSSTAQLVSSLFNVSSLTNSISASSSSSGWKQSANTGKLDTSVASGARDKYTVIKGNNKDTVTIMLYMCGADLESKNGLATSDLQEMCNAQFSDNVNLIVYAGGTTKWHNSIFSSSTNQIYKVENGGVQCLSKNEGNVCMTEPSTLSGFIKFCAKNYPANRYQLIFWDHGSGSLSGYGYDERFPNNGSMSLAGINQALSKGGVKFDFVGFDACLMATAENGLMLSNYADYMIASEETEAGYGWYYTNWLTALSQNTSMSTIELGKKIVDDFVDSCAQKVPGQKATLSLTDLAELSATMPESLTDFATSTSKLIKDKNNYKIVSDARSSCRQFSTSKIDQVDLVNLALNMDTEEGKELADAILGAVKYNRTSTNMTNAYGLSIYFPYEKTARVSSAVSTYESIGMDDEYADCIKAFAGTVGSGQVVQTNSYQSNTSGASSILPALLQMYSGTSASDSSTQLITTLLSSMLTDRSVITPEETESIVAANSFDASNLVWTRGDSGYEIALSEEQWDQVKGLELNVFYDDGEGYIDLGLDNMFTVTERGTLLADFDGSWLAVDGQPVAYYHCDTVDDGTNYTITGRIPALLNGTRVNLIVVFDNDNPYGYIAGANTDYQGSVDVIAKNICGLEDGDVIDFLCDYYDYNGNYTDSYMLGDSYTVNGQPEISNVYLPDSSKALASYVFTDRFAQEYWTPVVPE